MLESMDMVAYIDGLGDPVLTGPERSEIAAWANTMVTKAVPLTWPAGVTAFVASQVAGMLVAVGLSRWLWRKRMTA